MTFASLTGRRALVVAGAALALRGRGRRPDRGRLGSPGHAARRAERRTGHDRRLRVSRARRRAASRSCSTAGRSSRRPRRPGATFDPNLLYQFKIDNDGDALEDKVIQVTFTGSGSAQQVEVRGPVDPPVVGAMQNEVADVSPAVSGALNTAIGSSSGHPGRSPDRETIRSSLTSRPRSASSPTASRPPARSANPAR